MGKVLVLGIDGAPPQFVFDKWLSDLPNFKKLMDDGVYGRLRTTDPPVSIVAWSTIFSGKGASDTGIYDYVSRDGFSYTNRLTTSQDIKVKMIWDILGEVGKKSYVLHVPLSYPVREINGQMVSGFLTPEFNEQSATNEIRSEIKEMFTDFMFDASLGIASYKNIPPDEMIELVYKMTKQNFDLLYHCIENKDWDFISCVLIGSDRIQHNFWRYIDDKQKNYVSGSQYNSVLKDYYVYLDKQLGILMSKLPSDTTVLICSDHGMERMNCRFNLNDWLRSEGYLVLKNEPSSATPLKMSDVDWSKTKVFATGAYFGMLYFNIEGREPFGILSIEEYDSLQKELVAKLKLIKDDKGGDMDNRFILPQDMFKGEYAEHAPDIMVYFDNLICGVNNDVGNGGFYTWATTKGSDDAGHSSEGIFILSGNDVAVLGEKYSTVYDITPTILNKFGLDVSNFDGKIIDSNLGDGDG